LIPALGCGEPSPLAPKLVRMVRSGLQVLSVESPVAALAGA